MEKYILFFIIAIITLRIITLLIRKTKKINWYYEISLFIFTLFLVLLLSYLITPKFNLYNKYTLNIVERGIRSTNIIPFKVIINSYNSFIDNNNTNYFLVNLLFKIMIFVPIGFFIPLFLEGIYYKKVILLGCLFSFFIEFYQIFIDKGANIDDIILNTIGTFVGFLTFKYLEYKHPNTIKKIQK